MSTWTDLERKLLADLYSSTRTAELVPLFGRSILAIKRMAEKHGMRKSDDLKGIWSDAETAEFVRLYPDTPLRELTRIFGRSKYGILSKGADLGLKKSAEFIASGDAGSTGQPSKKRAAFIEKGAPLFSQPTGASLQEVSEFTGIAINNARCFLYKAARGGVLFRAGTASKTRYFLSAEAAAAGGVLIAAESSARRAAYVAGRLRLAREQSAERRAARRAAKPPKVAKVKAPKPPREPKPPKAAKPAAARVKPEVSTARQRTIQGPATRDIPADYSRAIRVEYLRQPGRFEVPDDFRGAFSLVGVGRDLVTGAAWGAA